MRKLFSSLFFTSVLFILISCYHPDIQQGNDYAPTIHQIKLGMTQSEVTNILGSPVLKNTFSSDSLTYVYSMYPNHKKITKQKIILYFKNGRLVKIEKN